MYLKCNWIMYWGESHYRSGIMQTCQVSRLRHESYALPVILTISRTNEQLSHLPPSIASQLFSSVFHPHTKKMAGLQGYLLPKPSAQMWLKWYAYSCSAWGHGISCMRVWMQICWALYHAYAILSALHFCRNYSEMKVHDCKSTAMHATTIASVLAEPHLLITCTGLEAPWGYLTPEGFSPLAAMTMLSIHQHKCQDDLHRVTY